MSNHHKLIEDWRKCRLDSPPYLFPDDKPNMLAGCTSVYQNFDEYVTSSNFGKLSDKSLHVGLLPLPYIGNLSKASIFILMLNPGLSPGDYFAEEFNPEFRKALGRNLRQENIDDAYPFFPLNPHFAWHPSSVYWRRKLHTIIHALAVQFEMTYQQAMSRLAQNLACLELLPYHSRSFGAWPLLKTLPSSKVMLEFVHEVVIPKAQDNSAIIIATRRVKSWRLPEHENIITYEGGETRSAHLGLGSRGGQGIAAHLGLSINFSA